MKSCLKSFEYLVTILYCFQNIGYLIDLLKHGQYNTNVGLLEEMILLQVHCMAKNVIISEGEQPMTREQHGLRPVEIISFGETF